jgi:hypothetical protein
VANVLYRGLRSSSNVIGSRTKDTPATGGHIHDLTNTNDSSSEIEEGSDSSPEVEEDSDSIGPKGDTSNRVRPRAKKASGTNLSVMETPKKRRKMSIHFPQQMTCSAVNNIPDSLI